jgi:hypothetical protein
MKRTVLSVATLVAVGFVGSAQAVNLVNETNSATPTSGELQPGSSSYVNTSGGTNYGLSRGVQILRESTSAQHVPGLLHRPEDRCQHFEQRLRDDRSGYLLHGRRGRLFEFGHITSN